MGKFELDDAQKNAVKADINSVVSAGAGSGKTRVLAERFAYLVAHRNRKVDEILTLTFTKKATNEMYGRIYKTLKNIDEKYVADFYKAKIQTLDSYCASVVKTGAHFYGIRPDFTEDDETVQETITSMALPFILKNRDNTTLQQLIGTRDYTEIAQELFVKPFIEYSSVAFPIDFEATLEKQKDEVLKSWKNYSSEAYELYSNLENGFNNVDANKDTIFGKKMQEFFIKGISEPPLISEEDFTTGRSEKLELFTNEFSAISFTSQGGVRGEAWAETKSILNQMRDLSGTLESLANFVYGFPISKKIIPLLEDFQNQVNDKKRSLGVLTFKDVSDLAVLILKEHPEIRFLEKQKYKSILIDEFQDNNSTQRDLLFMLAEKKDRMEKGVPEVAELEPDKLFFVGDEKQSIYRFRGADVSVFRQLKNSFQKGNLELKTNYRSHPALIAAFNTIFGGASYPPAAEKKQYLPRVFMREEYDKDIPPYEAVYKDVLISKQDEEIVAKEKQNAYSKRIHFALYNTESAPDTEENPLLDNDETEAYWIANKIKSLLKGENGRPPVKPSDIAVLMRTYSSQPTYERIFLQLGIPYNTEVVKGFFNDGPINDLVSYLRLCIYPSDTMAYSTVLRSPFVNLSSKEAEAVLACHQNGNDLFSSSEQNALPLNSSLRFRAAGIFFNKINSFSKTAPITQTLSKLWYELGYRYETLWNNKVEMYTSLYDRLFELARLADKNSTGLGTFVDSIRTYEDQDEKLDGMDIPLIRGESVHILTIFKSKGLEYPVVFICGADKRTKYDSNAEAVFFSKEFGISINTSPCKSFEGGKSNYFFNKMKELESSQKSAELRRIVYVAITRAINEVYITGKYKGDFEKADQYALNGEKNPDTTLNILLPVLSYYSQEENKANSPFTLEEIPYATRASLFEQTQDARGNTENDKRTLFKKAATLYSNAQSVVQEQLQPLYVSPSQLHSEDDETSATEIPQVTKDTPYPEINKIVESTRIYTKEYKLKQSAGENPQLPEPKFGYNNFGTIAHAYLEAAVKKCEPDISTRDTQGLEENKTKINKVFEICTKMAETFKSTQLGKDAMSSDFHKAEYNFRSRIGNKIVKGTIDLLFKNKDGTYTIVDYKTNQTKEPDLYYNQLACYRQAVGQMIGISPDKIKCVLYYLRFGEPVDITDKCNSVNVDKIVNTK
ncbi:MAG: UvrD-helicase domain-containing protein [Treponema sp.]